ncbi:aspartyl/asparaginyl beta-hydroxylase domain-containing protein [Vicingaceae bacterium]|nr:aspartyl/asparaginyl beta-hydroxylase domain-containing protein [Vicingaceae bacterium]
MKKDRIWYSYTLQPYVLEEERYYDSEKFEWTKALENNSVTIQNEVLAYIEGNELKPYFNKALVSKPNQWKTDGLLFWGYFSRKNYSNFVETWSIIKSIPGLVSFSISVLEAGTVIKEHNGDTNAIIRVHLPILVPEGLPNCSFTVANETRPWQVGKTILFNDAQEHWAQNLSSGKRVVLLIDVIRPEFLHRKFEICAKVLNGLGWQWQTQWNSKFRALPMWAKKAWWAFTRWVIRNVLRVNRLFWA